jgi:hypothetical protein
MEQGILEATEINSIHSSYVMHIGNDANATEERENNKLLARNPTKKKNTHKTSLSLLARRKKEYQHLLSISS